MLLLFTSPARRGEPDRDIRFGETKCFNCGNSWDGELFEPILKWNGCHDQPIHLHEECSLEMLKGLTRDLFELEGVREAERKTSGVMGQFKRQGELA